MKMISKSNSQEHGAAMVIYLILLMVAVSTIGAVMTYLSGNVQLQHRRYDLVAAQQFAQGGAVIACDELNTAFMNKTQTMAVNLAAKGYALDSSLSNSGMNVYKRTISAPFVAQAVQTQLWIPNVSSPGSAKIVATATKGKVTQSATVNLNMAWGWAATIISTNAGTNNKGTSSSAAKEGNVAIDGDKSGPLIVDGGQGQAIIANGMVNIDTAYATVDNKAVSGNNYGTSNEIPDYTAQGTANALFDFKRFIAVADSTPNAHNTGVGTNHFTSLASFLKANALAAATPAGALEGVIVVDITSKSITVDVGIDVLADPAKYIGTTYLPAANPQKKGISVKGTLFFNFSSAYGPLDKIFNRLAMNINPADLTSLNPADTATYTSGYSAVYSDPTKKASNINITSKGFTNFTPSDDLPAFMYSIGTIDLHGPVNISGVVYTPSYSEIENKPNEGFKVANQIQYIRGTVIVGLGLYYQNVQAAKSIISYDSTSVDSLATFGNAGKKLNVGYWQ